MITQSPITPLLPPLSSLDVDNEHLRNRSEEAIRTSEVIYRRLFEAARDGILLLEVESGRITDVNPFLEKLLNFSRNEMIGKTVGELSPFKDIESNKIMLERLQQDGYVRYEDLPLETRGGRHIAVEFVCNVYQAGDSQVIQCNIRDMTENKLARDKILRLQQTLEERVIQRTTQLQTAIDDLDAFSYSVSHDLRAPLRQIMGFVKLLEVNVGAWLAEKDLRFLSIISQSTKRMSALIDDLLAFSRVGHSELRKTEVNLGNLIREALAVLESETRERKIIWNIATLPSVWVDRSLMLTVLVNLISNAIKFTRNRDEACIEIGVHSSGDQETVFFIRDNGAGFNPKYAAKLFGVFQRLHSESEFEGTGIGLANVQRIIHRHGGRIWAEGVPDSGATFYISIPNQKDATHDSQIQ